MAIIYVKTGATGNGSSGNSAFGSLASAIAAAQAIFSLFLGAANAATITSIAGDKDCFGTGSNICNTIAVFNIVQGTNDIDFDFFTFKTFQWSHNYSLPASSSITSAVLKIVTFDLEDNGAGDGFGGIPFDDRLFIDGIEVSGAFDDVSTPDGNAFTPLPVNVTIFNLNSLFFSSLADGNVNIALNSFGGTRADAIAIDYAELEIQTISEPLTSVPEPSTILGIVTLGLGALLSKKCNQDDNAED
jgi:hypothetical protein